MLHHANACFTKWLRRQDRMWRDMCDPVGATGLPYVRIGVETVVLTHDLWEHDAVLFRLVVISCNLACLMKGGL